LNCVEQRAIGLTSVCNLWH